MTTPEALPFDDLKRKLKERYGVDYGHAEGSLAPFLGAEIWHGLTISSEKLKLFHSEKLFNPLHGEKLLEQAAQLMDRCILDRAAYQALSVEALRFCLEVKEFGLLDHIHKREETAGIHIIASTEANAILEAARMERDFLESNVQSIKALASWRKGGGFTPEQVRHMESELAYVQRMVVKDTGEPVESRTFDHRHYVRPVKGTSNPNLHVCDHAFELTAYLAEYQEKLREHAETQEKGTLSGRRLENEKRLLGLEARAKFAKEDAAFRAERSEAARTIMRDKIASALRPDGVLDYGARLRAFANRFQNDFDQAYPRILSAWRGLSVIFDLPNLAPPNVKENDTYPYEDVVTWIRGIQGHLARLFSWDEGHSVSVSIASLKGENVRLVMTKALEQAQERSLRPTDTAIVWHLEIGRELLPEQYNVRLRGLTAFAKCESTAATFRVRVDPPAAVLFVKESGTQEYRPEASYVLLGRVGSRAAPRSPETAGLQALHNLSPICAAGESWRVSLDFETLQNAVAEGVADLELEFQVVCHFSH